MSGPAEWRVNSVSGVDQPRGGSEQGTRLTHKEFDPAARPQAEAQRAAGYCLILSVFHTITILDGIIDHRRKQQQGGTR